MNSGGLPVMDSGCCGGSSGQGSDATPDLHSTLGDLLSRYKINEFAASVKILAVKP